MAGLPPSPFQFAASDAVAEQAAACPPQPPSQHAAAEIPDDLKQRFLAAIEEDYRFSLDQEKFLFDIGCVPEDFEKYIALVDQLTETDEPPLFLQKAG